MADGVRKAVGNYFATCRQEFASMEKPVRMWHTPTGVGKGVTGTTGQQKTDYWRAARQVVKVLRTRPEFGALIESIASDSSLAGSPAANDAQKYWGGPDRHPALRSTQRAHDFIDGFVTIPLVDYLDAGDSLGCDSAAAKNVLERLVADLGAHKLIIRRTVPLAGTLVAEGPHHIATGVVVRRVGTKDLESWLNGDDISRLGVTVTPGHLDVLGIEVVADITTEAERTIDAFRDRPNAATEQLLATLRLVTGGRIDAPFWEERVAGMATVHRPISIHPLDLGEGRKAVVDAAAAHAALELWPKLEGYPDVQTAGVAVRRFNDATTRLRADDRLIDHWIALESLFNPKKSPEIQFRAAFRIGAYVGSTADERVKIYEFMRSSYNRRSEVAHGSVETNVKQSTEEVAERTGEILRRALLKVLVETQFKPEGIEVTLLRGEPPGGTQ